MRKAVELGNLNVVETHLHMHSIDFIFSLAHLTMSVLFVST